MDHLAPRIAFPREDVTSSSLPMRARTSLTTRNSEEPGWMTWSTPISIQAFVQRLSLLVELELPCVICLGNTTSEDCCHGVFRECHRRNGRLILLGDHFSLHLVEEHLGTLRLVHRQRQQDCETSVEISNDNGTLVARILSSHNRLCASVWQDIMDSFALSLA